MNTKDARRGSNSQPIDIEGFWEDGLSIEPPAIQRDKHVVQFFGFLVLASNVVWKIYFSVY